ncbi:MAG TPA: endolytic transglycosylase MltG, partial [Bryobacteraceae bacterium]|nr:endolytic transglycosylase MltG [Bryobacteraceae bacterium]
MRPVRLLLLAGAILLVAAATSLWMPYGGLPGDAFVDIPRGTSSIAVARLLSEAGVVRFQWQYLAARLLRPRARIQAGEYCFREPLSPWGVVGRLVKGDVFFYELTVPEGQNIFDIAASLDKLGAIGGDRFLSAARDPAPIRDLAADARTLEGYLFPDTYRITRQTTATQLCAQMTDRFRKAWAQTGASGPVHAVVTLASLIEKETARPEERPLVASVFHNRLRLGMPLDCDPTAIYAALLDGRYRGEIYRSDLESRNRYNTYQY